MTDKHALAERAFTALQQADATAYLALLPSESDLPAACPMSRRYTELIPKIQTSVEEAVRDCAALIDWSQAEVEVIGYDYTPSPESDCNELIGHGDATYRITIGGRQFTVTVEDVTQIGERFFAFDHPQCHPDDASL